MSGQTRSRCGRFALDHTADDLVREFSVVTNHVPGWVPRWNIAPTTAVPIVLERAGVRELGPARWSLVPRCAPQLTLKYPTFNARSETAAVKPSFRDSVAHHRCLIPACGYFEWVSAEGVKTPHYIYHPATPVLAFAGLYSWWRDPQSGHTQATATILTRDSAGPLTEVHHRMPLMVPPARYSRWLSATEHDGARMIEEISEATLELAEGFTHHLVAPLAGDGPALIAAAPTTESGSVGTTRD